MSMIVITGRIPRISAVLSLVMAATSHIVSLSSLAIFPFFGVTHFLYAFFKTGDPDHDVYGHRREFESSQEGSYAGYAESSAPNIPVRAPYPAWNADRPISLSTEEIEDVFLDLMYKFGFQRDSMRNMASQILHLFKCAPWNLPCYPPFFFHELSC
jgi:hypothetical protein